MNRRETSGLTLPEAVLTVFLVGMVFGLAANLMSQGYAVLRFSALKENSLLTAQVALERMTSESREAVSVTAPAAGGQSQELQFAKIDPNVVRFPGGTPWNPLAGQMTVRYFTDGQGNLNRETPAGTETVVRGIYGLTCERPATGTLSLRVAVYESRGVRALTSAVYLP